MTKHEEHIKWLLASIERGALEHQKEDGAVFVDQYGDEVDRTKVVTASRIGWCLRRIYYDMQSPGHTARSTLHENYGVFARGHAVEARLVDWITRGQKTELELEMIGMGEKQMTIVSRVEGYDFGGTPDGIALLPDRKVVIYDFKSVSPFANPKYFPKSEHVKQVHVNCSLLEVLLYQYGTCAPEDRAEDYSKECHNLMESIAAYYKLEEVEQLADLEVVGSVLFYVDASDWGKFHPKWVPRLPYDEEDALIDRVVTVNRAKTAADLPTEGVHTNTCRYCPHTKACSNEVAKTMKGKPNVRKSAEAASKLFK